MKRTLLFLSFLFTSGLVVSAQELRTIISPGPQPVTPIITSDQVSGVYRDGTSELRLLALDPNKLKIEFKSDWTIAG